MVSIRGQYEGKGVSGFYQREGHAYRNPHEEQVRETLRLCSQQWELDLSEVLDLACGSGEVTLEVRALGGQAEGIDPYTGVAYLQRTGQVAESLTFGEIAVKGLGDCKRFSLVCCSYALHLLDPSWLPALLFQLGTMSSQILILSPHKRPDLTKYDCPLVQSLVHKRVHASLYDLHSNCDKGVDMSASREDLQSWYVDGQKKGATHLIVALDPWDHENYPIFVMPGGKTLAQEIASLEKGHRYDEIYSYSPQYTWEGQKAERRAIHWD